MRSGANFCMNSMQLPESSLQWVEMNKLGANHGCAIQSQRVLESRAGAARMLHLRTYIDSPPIEK